MSIIPEKNKIATGFEITAGTVKNWTQDCESGTAGNGKTTAVWTETVEKEREA